MMIIIGAANVNVDDHDDDHHDDDHHDDDDDDDNDDDHGDDDNDHHVGEARGCDAPLLPDSSLLLPLPGETIILWW